MHEKDKLEFLTLMCQEWFANVWIIRRQIEENPKLMEKVLSNAIDRLVASNKDKVVKKTKQAFRRENIMFYTLITMYYVALSILFEMHGTTLKQWLKKNRLVLFSYP